MGWTKTPEEKAAGQQQREAARAAADQQRAEAEYWASPVGQAVQARHNGARFFQVEIPHSSIRGFTNAAFNSRTQGKISQHGDATDVLGQIEEAGWRLEQASWVYMQTGQNSRDKFLASGQQVVVTGEVLGIYLFRAV